MNPALRKSPPTPHSDLKKVQALATTDRTHHNEAMTHANARSGRRQVLRTRYDAICYRRTPFTYIERNKGSSEQSPPEMVEWTPHLPEKNEMQHEWQTQSARKPIVECGLEHCERKMTMEKHATHLVEERFRWSERRKMRNARRAFGVTLPTYQCPECIRIRMCIRIWYSVVYNGSWDPHGPLGRV